MKLKHNTIYICTFKNEILKYIIKYVQDLYEENDNHDVRSKEELKKWRYSPYSRIRRLNAVKMSVLLNLNYRFNKTPSDIQQIILLILTKYLQTYNYKVSRERQKIEMATTILKNHKV